MNARETPDLRSETAADAGGRAVASTFPIVATLEAIESWLLDPTPARRDSLAAALAAIVEASNARGAWLEVDAPPLPGFTVGAGSLAGRPVNLTAGVTTHELRADRGRRELGSLWLDGAADGDLAARALELALDAAWARATLGRTNEQLAALAVATRAIAGILDVESALQLIVDRVRELLGARYAALGIAAPDGTIERFITSGISSADRAAIGPLPRGHGLLGLIIREGRTIRVPRIAAHPASSGFPANHPPMTTFLGVPVRAQGRSIGNFYLTDKLDGAPFSEDDERTAETFALHAGIAIENARLHEQVGRLAVVEERDRIGRDLHDGIIQSLYAVGLSLEDVLELMAESPAEAELRVDRAIESINLAIRDIRNFIYGLRPETADGSDVVAGLAALAEETRLNAMIEVEASLDEGVALRLSDEAGRHLLQLVREALSNAARHGRARRIWLELAGADGAARLEVADDGVGFDPAVPPGEGHHGLANMRARAQAIGGTLDVDSEPGAGTRIILELPAPPSEPPP